MAKSRSPTEPTRRMEEVLATRPPRTVTSALFNMAHSYARSSDDAWTRVANSGDADFAAPAIMCQCFAVELLLKFFLVLEHPDAATEARFDRLGLNLRGHRFTELFDRLSDPSKAKIAGQYGRQVGKPTEPAAFRDALVSLGDDPFVLWRYTYESNGVSTLDKPLLDHVTDSLGKAAEAERRRLAAKRIGSSQ